MSDPSVDLLAKLKTRKPTTALDRRDVNRVKWHSRAHKRRSNGLCTRCARARSTRSTWHCDRCLDEIKAERDAWRAANKDRHRETRRKVRERLLERGACTTCLSRPALDGVKQCYRCREHDRKARPKRYAE